MVDNHTKAHSAQIAPTGKEAFMGELRVGQLCYFRDKLCMKVNVPGGYMHRSYCALLDIISGHIISTDNPHESVHLTLPESLKGLPCQ